MSKGDLRPRQSKVKFRLGPIGPTIVYLVFDPADSLSPAAKGHQPGKFSGIPCEVPRVQRLESHWYAVTFYTEESWGERNRLNCSGSARSWRNIAISLIDLVVSVIACYQH